MKLSPMLHAHLQREQRRRRRHRIASRRILLNALTASFPCATKSPLTTSHSRRLGSTRLAFGGVRPSRISGTTIARRLVSHRTRAPHITASTTDSATSSLPPARPRVRGITRVDARRELSHEPALASRARATDSPSSRHRVAHARDPRTDTPTGRSYRAETSRAGRPARAVCRSEPWAHWRVTRPVPPCVCGSHTHFVGTVIRDDISRGVALAAKRRRQRCVKVRRRRDSTVDGGRRWRGDGCGRRSSGGTPSGYATRSGGGGEREGETDDDGRGRVVSVGDGGGNARVMFELDALGPKGTKREGLRYYATAFFGGDAVWERFFALF